MFFYSLSDYLKNTYGEKLYKLSLSGSTSCPNRDGTIGTGGCIFCSEGGSGDFASPAYLPVDKQIELAKERIKGKKHSNHYIAYFQSYTGTYGNLDELFTLYTETIKRPDIKILSIGTRPDCINDEVIKRLNELNKIKPVWIELGLQTSKEETAKLINRGYENETYKKAVKALNSINVLVITHVIIGLPGETEDDIKNTVQYAVDAGTWGLKLQLLHVLENTPLANMYKEKEFKTLKKDEYIDIICNLIPMIPEDIVIHRLTGDGPKNILISPLWSGNKRDVMNKMNHEMAVRKIKQGSLLRGVADENNGI